MEERNCIGIIAEFDPFHRGHAHLIGPSQGRPARCAGGLRHERTLHPAGGGGHRQQVRPGGDGPPMRGGLGGGTARPVAVSSAESFAQGGVQLLHALASPTWPLAVRAATCPPYGQWPRPWTALPFPPPSVPTYSRACPSPAPDRRRWEGLVGQKTAACLTQPNNLLGIEYLRAIQTLAPELEALTIPRVGAAHNAPGVTEGFASASQIRQWLLAGEIETACAQMPGPAAGILRGQAPAALTYNARGILTILRRMTPEDWRALPTAARGWSTGCAVLPERAPPWNSSGMR